jgi:ATP-dependent Zn protease
MGENNWGPLLIAFALFLLIIGVCIFMFRRMQSGSDKVLSFGKSRPKMFKNPQSVD